MAKSKKRKNNEDPFSERILVRLQKEALASEIPVVEAPDLASAIALVESVSHPVFLFAWIKSDLKEKTIISYKPSVLSFMDSKGIYAGHRKHLLLVMAGTEFLEDMAKTMNEDLAKGVQVFAPGSHP